MGIGQYGGDKQLPNFSRDQFHQIDSFSMSGHGKKLAVVRAYTSTVGVLIKDLNAR